MEHRPRSVSFLELDVPKYGPRSMRAQAAIRKALDEMLPRVFDKASIPWMEVSCQDEGDSRLILIPADISPNLLVQHLPCYLAAALREHNEVHARKAQFKLRVAVHAGAVLPDQGGQSSPDIVLTRRLLDSRAVRAAVKRSPDLALIVSDSFFQQTVRPDPTCDPKKYRKARVRLKGIRTIGHIRRY